MLEVSKFHCIWIYNDSQFTSEDLKNITKLGGASKENDSSKIGKFGLGFCAVYNITDVPSFISGKDLVFFDPHTTFLGKALPGRSPGLRINFQQIHNRKMLQRVRNQFKPYEGIFDCNILDCIPDFRGTLFRLPLRTRGSEISNEVYTSSDVKDLLDMIMNRASNMLLFSQNVDELRMYHLNKYECRPENMKLIFETRRSVSNLLSSSPEKLHHPILSEAAERKRCEQLSSSLMLLQRIVISGTRKDCQLFPDAEASTFKGTWLISWATGSDKQTLQMTAYEHKALCLGAVAVPVTEIQKGTNTEGQVKVMTFDDLPMEFYRKGHVFFFLPLPVEHSFPFHVNGQFSVTPDRRYLCSSSKDDRTTNMQEWNRCLLSDPIVLALLYLLENIHSFGELSFYRFYDLWPRKETGELFRYLTESFYQHITQPGVYKVFESAGNWFDISECVFLERSFRNSAVGTAAIKVLCHTTTNVLDVSDEIYELMIEGDRNIVLEKTVDAKMFFLEHLFPHLETLDHDVNLNDCLDNLLSYAICLNDIDLNEWLKHHPCISIRQSEKRKRPSQVIDPASSLSEMYYESDGFFPKEIFLSAQVMGHLRDLGCLFEHLPDDFLIDRAHSIEKLASACKICAAIRSGKVLSYLTSSIDQHKHCFSVLQDVAFIPVLSKPPEWPFRWKCETVVQTFNMNSCQSHPKHLERFSLYRLEKARDVYHQDSQFLVCCVKYIFDGRFCIHDTNVSLFETKTLLKQIGMRGILLQDFQEQPDISKTTGIRYSHSLHLSNPPELCDVIEQLSCVANDYGQKCKGITLNVIDQIYKWFKYQDNLSKTKLKVLFENKFESQDRAFIWVGTGFQPPSKIYLQKNKDSIDLTPFVFSLPQEVEEFADLFRELGCSQSLHLDMLLDTLKLIKETSEQETSEIICSADRLLELSVAILNKLSEEFMHELDLNEREIFFPVRDKSSESKCLQFAPAKQCTYCDFEWFQDITDDDIIEIHPLVPKETAESLGVLSLRQQLLSEADAFEEWGQEEPLTRRLQYILKNGYIDGFSLAKEMLQNADDAGAKKLWIIYDERENDDAKTHLLNEKMAECQGPAIWIYNDAQFSSDDLKNITKLSGATKEQDTTKIGKFGLGFCAVYNVTDVPSFISGQNLVIFDPHTTFLGKALPGRRPGLKINFRSTRNSRIIKRMQHQFKPFEGICNCSILDCGPDYPGTLFRLPLRQKASDISDTVYSSAAVKELIALITHRSANMLMFNQSVEEVKIFHLQKNENHPSNMKLLFEARKRVINLSPTSLDLGKNSVLVEATNLKKKNLLDRPFRILQSNTITGQRLNESQPQTYTRFGNTYILSWATGISESAQKMTKTNTDELCLAAVAIPIQKKENFENIEVMALNDVDEEFYKKGHIFVFLPLPVEHSFSFHINGQFGVTSDRRHLNSSSEDDRNTQIKDWNECLLSDPVVQALLYLLENLHTIGDLSLYRFYQLWPKQDMGTFMHHVSDSFYQQVLKPKGFKVFERDGRWFDISQCFFIEHKLRQSVIGEDVYKALSILSINVVDVPHEIYSLLLNADKHVMMDKTITEELFFLNQFLPNLHCFDKEETLRTKLVLHAVLVQNTSIDHWLKENSCIPSLPSGMLKRPNELVDPSSALSEMFEESDGFFPFFEFRSLTVLQRLRDIGLIHDIMPDNFLLNRAESAKTLKERCKLCAAVRSSHVLVYLSRKQKQHSECFSALMSIDFLPVKGKPPGWPFTWKGPAVENDTCNKHPTRLNHCKVSSFAKASALYFSGCINLLGCTELIFEERMCMRSVLSSESENLKTVFEKLEMKGVSCDEIPLENVIRNFDEMLRVSASSTAKFQLQTVVKEIYSFLDKKCQSKPASDEIRDALKDKPCICIRDSFVKPEVVAVSCPFDCMPYLIPLEQTLLFGSNNLIKTLDIAHHFEPRFIGTVLWQLKETKHDEPLTANEIRSAISVLTCLDEALNYHKIIEVETLLDDQLSCIFAPDETGILQDSRKMCFNDYDQIEKSETMIYCHEDIPGRLAKKFGIQPKVAFNLEEDSSDVEDFYQEEPLVTRLKRLTEGYPCDSGIFKELIQNADDAGASEIHFLIDSCTHSTVNIMTEEFKPLQGPALCVYNNSSFSQEDLKGIRKLGIGSKGGDPSKTGKYGVGFNSVYNITDVPSFYTKGGDIANNETLCFFDPLAKYIPNVSAKKPGKRYRNLSKIRRYHSNVMEGYHENFFFSKSDKGTVFRFPLRTPEMAETSRIKQKSTSVTEVQEHIQSLSKEAKEMIVFLKNLKTVRISETVLNQNGGYEYHTQLCVSVKMNDESENRRKLFLEERTRFYNSVKSNKEHTLTANQQTFVYEMSVSDEHVEWPSQKISTCNTKYTVAQTVGFKDPDKIPKLLKTSILGGEIGLLPEGGVALCSASPRSDIITSEITASKAYCFLPLPIYTGLPVSVNGYFALEHEVRRSLYRAENPEHCSKTLWNSAIIQQVITPAYICLLEFTKSNKFFPTRVISGVWENVVGYVMTFLQLLPDLDRLSDNYWKELLQCLFTSLVADSIAFLPIFKTTLKPRRFCGEKTLVKVKDFSWTPLYIYGCQFPAYYYNIQAADHENTAILNLVNVLGEIGMRIVVCSQHVIKGMCQSGSYIYELQPKHVIDYLLSYKTESPGRCLIELNMPVNQTVIHNERNLLSIIRFCLKDRDCFVANMQNLPLYLTQDGICRALPEYGFFYVDQSGQFSDLFPSQLSVFLHKCIVPVLEHSTIDYENSSGNKLRQFTLEKFANLVRETSIIPSFIETSVLWHAENPTKSWIQTFWIFFASCLASTDKDLAEGHLKVINHLALIPATDNLEISSLVPPVYRKSLLDKASFIKNKNLYRAVQSLPLPVIDESLFQTNETLKASGIYDTLRSTIPRFECADEVVECLYQNKEILADQNVSIETAVVIMQYFSEYLDTHSELPRVKEKLKCLPVFCTRFGAVTAVDSYASICVVPRGIPENGLAVLAKESNVLLLDDIGCQSLYMQLDISSFNIVDVYIRFIIPHQHKMHRKDFYAHVEFIAYRLTYDETFQNSFELIDMLRSTEFVHCKEGTLVSVSKLFDPRYLIFRKMCQPSELVPEELQKLNILKMFRKLGMVTAMNIGLFQRFAQDVEMKGHEEGLSAEVRQISSLLVTELLSMKTTFFAAENFSILCNINFVLPYEPCQSVTNIHISHSGKNLISYNSAVVYSGRNTCWTVSNILSAEADPTCICTGQSAAIVKALRIRESPSLQELVNHLRNVGQGVAKTKIPNNIQPHILVGILQDIYRALDDFRKKMK